MPPSLSFHLLRRRPVGGVLRNAALLASHLLDFLVETLDRSHHLFDALRWREPIAQHLECERLRRRFGALTERSAAKWHDWHEKDRRGEIEHVEAGAVDEFGISRRRIKHPSDNPPEDYVAGANQLFQRLTSPSSRLESAGGPIVLTSKHRKSFRRLHDLRNTFTHFSPKGWSIEVEFIRDLMRDVLEVIELIEHDDWPFRHMEREDRTRLREKISQLRLLLSER